VTTAPGPSPVGGGDARAHREVDRDDPRVRWNARHAARIADPTTSREPSGFLTARADLLPASGRALDVAGGTGRDASWLAGRGLDVTLVDVSDTACAEATRRAVEAGVTLDVVRLELGTDPLPAGPFDVVVVHHWLDRDVWRALPGHLAVGGVLLACQPTARNLDRHDRPPRHFLLDDGEAVGLAADLATSRDGASYEVVEATEGWTDQDRHEACIVVRRRA
jgi:tellurite methyltransferase